MVDYYYGSNTRSRGPHGEREKERMLVARQMVSARRSVTYVWRARRARVIQAFPFA
jgi:hypothetical protein